MKQVVDLVNILTRFKISQIEDIDLQSTRKLSNGNMYQKFYDEFQNMDHPTDDDIFRKLYGSKGRRNNYSALKSRVINKLANKIFLIDLKNSNKSAYMTFRFEAYKFYVISRFFEIMGSIDLAARFARKSFLHARKYNLTDLVYLNTKILCRKAGFTGDRINFNKYQEINRNAFQTLDAERQVEFIWNGIMLNYSVKSSGDQEIAMEIESSLPGINTLYRNHNSHTLTLYYFRILSAYAKLKKNYLEDLAASKQFLDYLENNRELRTRNLIAEFSFNKLLSHLHLGNFKDGEESALKCLKNTDSNHINWFIYCQCYFLLAMQHREYAKALKIFAQVNRHKQFNDLPAFLKEKWRIFNAYLKFIIESGLAREAGENGQRHKGPFRISKFLNEVPVFSRDKGGMNVAILIIQFLFFYLRKEHDYVIDRMEALKLYRLRYLQNTGNSRANMFVRMLVKVPKLGFNPEAVEADTADLLRELRNSNFDYNENLDGFEIIPFEHLWKWMIDTLYERSGKKPVEV